MKKGLFESRESYERRLEKEEIEAMTGVRQGMWESFDKKKERNSSIFMTRVSKHL
ncbi:MAG: hypothetical protein LUE92_05570 [Clostridiales bacterium]|nr:hypothetical protein [Clostridiales bacterium]